jgi:Tfp pilus assembly protein PilF
LLLVIAGIGTPRWVVAQPDEPVPHAQREAEAQRIAEQNQRAMTAFARRDYMAAEDALRTLLRLDPKSFVAWYNLACALSLQGIGAESADALVKAV